MTPPAGGGANWSETVLYSFAGPSDGAFPSGGLVADQAGNLYGTTLVGGANDLGAVYQLSPPTTEGGAWTETVIFSFSGSDGTLPFGRLQFDETGAIYGTTTSGGSGQAGTVFKLTPQSQPGVSWNESVLYNFSGGRMGVALSRESSSTTWAEFLERPRPAARAALTRGRDIQAHSAGKQGRSMERDRAPCVWWA